jgi:hypothetical protein
MPLAGLSLLTPLGLLSCGSALLPLTVLVLTFRRQRRVARTIGLEPAPVRRAFGAGVLAATACLALGIAAAQPVLTTTKSRSARTSSEVVFVTDVSRSMLASAQPGGRTRLDRARSTVARLRAAVPEVPAGISGLTDRVLPYLFPTLDPAAFSETLARSVQADAPPPQEVSTVATAFGALASLVRDGFYSPGVKRRTCVVVTDGETRAGSGSVARLAGQRGCRVVVVRVGDASDRIFRAGGGVEAAYRPEVSAATTVERLARLSGGSAFSESELSAAARAVKDAADVGPRQRVGVETAAQTLAPVFAGVALVAVLLVLIRVFRRPVGGLRRARPPDYHPQTEIHARRVG